MDKDKDFIDTQKQKLLNEKARLEEELRFITNPSTENPERFSPSFSDIGKEEDENAQEVTAYEQNLALSHDLGVILDQVKEALTRIENGSYLKCKEGDEISKERLEALPWASTCIEHSK